MDSRIELISKIIRKKLNEEVDQILAISMQGFNVFAMVEFKEVQNLIIEILNSKSQHKKTKFKIIESHNNTELIQKSFDGASKQSPIIYVGESCVEAGFGLVQYHVRSPDQLIGHVGSAVEQILNYTGLEFYIDVFDSQKLNRLKQIARVQGLKSLIDAVVQTAYYAGYKGDTDSAQNYLDNTKYFKNLDESSSEIPLENCAKKFLAHVMSHGEDAHAFLKSCLSYYVVSKQGHTMTRASQILSISRTTLQEHIKIAHQLGVTSFLEGNNFKNSH